MSGKAINSAPTQPRPVDAQGHDLDEWGLPLSGPARRRRLAQLGKPDPNIDPAGWQAAAKSAAKPAAKPRAPRKPKVKVAPVVVAAPPVDPSAVEGASVPAVTETENRNG